MYENRNLVQELHGCLNDAQDFVTYLKRTLAVPPRNILSLFNESATRENILAAFNSHLIHNDQISKGDLIFFYYAGHGHRVVAAGYNENGRMVETICPYDITVFEKNSSSIGNARNTIYGIPDRTFNGLMRHLARTKGDNIVRVVLPCFLLTPCFDFEPYFQVSIFDCCHSGGIARGQDDSGPARFLSSRNDQLAPRPALPPGLDRELFKGVFDQDQDIVQDRYLSLVTPPGFAYRGEMSHVLLAACQSNEKAREHHDSGIPRGRFTSHLLQILRKVTPESGISQSITYATLIEAVSC